MNPRFLAAAFFVLMCALSTAKAGDAIERARKELEPRSVKLSGQAIPLDGALKSLQEQTGNAIVDGRLRKNNPMLALDLSGVTFWQAIDEITAKAGCGYSIYQEEGKLVLIDAPPRRRKVAYAGICRVAVKRVSVTRDDDSNHRYCDVLLEVAWEPRVTPLLLDVGQVGGEFAGYFDLQRRVKARPQSVKATPPGKFTVAGLAAAEVDVRLPAPDRRAPSIQELTGKLSLIAPSKLLTFRFAGITPGKEVASTQDDVKVTMKAAKPKPGRWAFSIGVTNPQGAPAMDSNEQFSLLLFHHRISLEKADEKPVRVLKNPSRGSVSIKPTPAKGMHISTVYSFTNDLPASQDGWEVVYHTPGRIVEVPLAFTLTDIPLP